MSQFPNPYTHLNQALIRPQQMMGMMQPQLDPTNPAMRLQAANALNQARRGSSGMMPGGFGGGSVTPMANNMMKAKSLILNSEMNSDEEVPDELKKLRDDPSVPMQVFEHLVKTYAAGRKEQTKLHPTQHDFSGTHQQVSSNPDAGTITVTRGHGPNAISPEEMQAMSQRVQRGFNGPSNWEKLVGSDIASQSMLKPKDAPGSRGFQITGAGVPQPSQAPDPIVQMHNSLQQAGVPDQALAQWRSLAQSGATPQHLYEAGQHLMTQMQSAGKEQQQQRQHDEQLDKDLLADNRKHQKELEEQDTGLLRGQGRGGTAKDYALLKQEERDIELRMKGRATPQAGGQQQQQSIGQQLQQPSPVSQEPKFDKDGKVVPGSRGPLNPHIVAGYISRLGGDKLTPGSPERDKIIARAKQAAAAEGWQL